MRLSESLAESTQLEALERNLCSMILLGTIKSFRFKHQKQNGKGQDLPEFTTQLKEETLSE